MNAAAEPEPTPAQVVEFVNQMAAGTLDEKLGIEVVEASPQRVVGRLPVSGNTQPYGLLHGGASATLAESLGSIGSALHAHSIGKIAVGIELNASHHRAARSGWVTGVAEPMSLGRSLATYTISITDDRDVRVCTARLTCILRDQPPTGGGQSSNSG